MTRVRLFHGKAGMWPGVVQAIPRRSGRYSCTQYPHWPQRDRAYPSFTYSLEDLDRALHSGSWTEILDPELELDEGI
jgi:hypothetical protein